MQRRGMPGEGNSRASQGGEGQKLKGKQRQSRTNPNPTQQKLKGRREPNCPWIKGPYEDLGI